MCVLARTREDLDGGNRDQHAKHRALLDGGVVSVQGRDLGRKRHAEAEVDGDVAGEGEHAHARVLELRLRHHPKKRRARGQTSTLSRTAR